LNTLSRTCLLGLLLLAIASVTFAADWANWRGPGYSGIQPDGPKLLDAWKKGPALVWTSEPTPSNDQGGYGSPVVANGKVYAYICWKGYPGGGVKDVIICLDAKTGTTVWKAVFPGKDYGRGSACTPTVAGGKVFAVGGNGFYCVDAATGKELWTANALSNDNDNGSGLASSAAVVGDVVVAGSPLRGFDVATGKQLWQCDTAGRNIDTSPIVWKAADRMLILANLGKFCAIDPTTGKIVWTTAQDGNNGTPTLSGDYCVVTNGVSLFKLEPDKGTKVFGTNLGDRGASQIIYNQHVYSYNNQVRCIDFTGKTLWENGVGGEIASVVAADGKGFVISGDGALNMWALTDTKPTFYKASIPVSAYTTPAIVDGKMYVRLRGNKGIGCYDLTTEPVPDPNAIDRSAWVATSITGAAQQVVSDNGERWSTGRAMKAGDWLQVDMLKSYKVKQIVLDSSATAGDAAQGVQVLISTDGTTFTTVADLTVAQTKAMNGLVKVDLAAPTEARYIKFINMGANGPSYWSVFNVTTTMDKM
jgi:outer membrane protein assembly factor BamB